LCDKPKNWEKLFAQVSTQAFFKLLQKRTSNLNVFKKLIFTFLYAIWLTFDVNNANCLEANT